MSVRKVTLEQAVDLSLRLPLPEQLRLISILSEKLSCQVVAESSPTQTSDKDDEETLLLVDLRAAGLLMDPTPEMLAWAAAWDALPESEKQEAVEELRNLKLDPPLSEIVIRAREFRPGWEWIVEP